jgi:hypothetical protein
MPTQPVGDASPALNKARAMFTMTIKIKVSFKQLQSFLILLMLLLV